MPGCSDEESTVTTADGGGGKLDAKVKKQCTGAFKIETLSGAPATETRGKDYIFDQKKLHTFKLEIAPKDWTWLQANALKEEFVPAKVVFEDKRYQGAAVRFKGA